MPFSLTRTSFTTGTILICAATAAISLHSGPAVVPEAMREVLRAITESLALMAVSIAFAAVLRSLLRRWKLPPLIPALAVVAAWASFLHAPGESLTLLALAPVVPALDPNDIPEQATTPFYEDKALYVLLLGPVIAIINSKFHLGLDTVTVAGILLGIVTYVVAHKSKSKAIALANIDAKATAYSAQLNAAAGKSPADAAKATDAIGRDPAPAAG